LQELLEKTVSFQEQLLILFPEPLFVLACRITSIGGIQPLIACRDPSLQLRELRPREQRESWRLFSCSLEKVKEQSASLQFLVLENPGRVPAPAGGTHQVAKDAAALLAVRMDIEDIAKLRPLHLGNQHGFLEQLARQCIVVFLLGRQLPGHLKHPG
jgi:hypothetical protein